MSEVFSIGGIEVGAGCKPLVIPEIGINHGGSLKVAKEMVDAAHRAGARLVKHQTHIVDDEMSHAAKRVVPGNSDRAIYDIMAECALSEDEEAELKVYVESKGMEFLSTPFSRAAADRLERMGAKAYKIGSGEMNNHPLVHHVASFGKPMIVSTGMNSLADVEKTVEILREHGVDFALMHTTNVYPTEPRLVRLGAMTQMKETFPDVPVGLSDHTTSNAACIAAIALGAQIVERHFTDVMTREGPDIVCSMDETALRELLRAADDVPQMLGGDKRPVPEEQVTIDFAFATVVTTRSIAAGEEFTAENLWVKRPGTGEILADAYESLLGRHAVCDIDDDEQLNWSMVV